MKPPSRNEELRNEIKMAEGSIQDIAAIPPELKEIYRTIWEIPMRSLIDMAADRGAYIDQSQSLNLFSESPTIGKLSSMYMYAWEKGVKTTYYLRSRPATSIEKTTIKRPSTAAANAAMEAAAVALEAKKEYTEAEMLTCSLENPGACEACQ